jgi:DnaJ-class molecular chaperone
MVLIRKRRIRTIQQLDEEATFARRERLCETCGGSGNLPFTTRKRDSDQCPDCDGRGIRRH